MRTTFLTIFVASAAFTASFSSFAQQTAARIACDDPAYVNRETIAELKDLKGNVLVSDKAGVSTAVPGQRVINKSRVTTASQAEVIVAFDCGCDVRLKENERLDIDVPRACSGLLAAVQAVPTAVALGATAPAAATLTTTGILTVGAVGVGGYLLYRRNRNVSPN
jgi:hypothetical protein